MSKEVGVGGRFDIFLDSAMCSSQHCEKCLVLENSQSWPRLLLREIENVTD